MTTVGSWFGTRIRGKLGGSALNATLVPFGIMLSDMRRVNHAAASIKS